MTAQSFPCTIGGAIARGRRRLALLLSVLGLLMLAATAISWWSGRFIPGLLAISVALVTLIGWHLATELVPESLEVEAKKLTIRTVGQRIEVPLEAAVARRLNHDEITHLERLASAGGMTTGSGGFDSHRLREFDLYASDFANAVLVEGTGGRLVVTPDDPEAFLSALER